MNSKKILFHFLIIIIIFSGNIPFFSEYLDQINYSNLSKTDNYKIYTENSQINAHLDINTVKPPDFNILRFIIAVEENQILEDWVQDEIKNWQDRVYQTLGWTLIYAGQINFTTEIDEGVNQLQSLSDQTTAYRRQQKAHFTIGFTNTESIGEYSFSYDFSFIRNSLISLYNIQNIPFLNLFAPQMLYYTLYHVMGHIIGYGHIDGSGAWDMPLELGNSYWNNPDSLTQVGLEKAQERRYSPIWIGFPDWYELTIEKPSIIGLNGISLTDPFIISLTRGSPYYIEGYVSEDGINSEGLPIVSMNWKLSDTGAFGIIDGYYVNISIIDGAQALNPTRISIMNYNIGNMPSKHYGWFEVYIDYYDLPLEEVCKMEITLYTNEGEERETWFKYIKFIETSNQTLI